MMKNTIIYFVVLLCVVLSSCENKEVKHNNDMYYISHNTFGDISSTKYTIIDTTEINNIDNIVSYNINILTSYDNKYHSVIIDTNNNILFFDSIEVKKNMVSAIGRYLDFDTHTLYKY